MSRHAYEDLLFGTQALRRRVERDALALGGALGVRAHLFPHQIGTVARVLGDTEVRHLLADEVGLGKTVEAVMILVALRLQEPDLRVLVVVPDHLRSQWRDELLTRGHQAPIERAPTGDADRRLRLAWPERLQPAEIDPTAYDVLVVDEFHLLTAVLQRRIQDTAPAFPHLLLVSATPPFHDPDRLDDLMAMLEPARAAVLGAELEADTGASAALSGWDCAVSELLASDTSRQAWEGSGGAPAEPRRRNAALAHCAYRRLVRSRREHYPRYMPDREHAPTVVEPTEAEVRRQRLMWRYFAYLEELARVFEPDLLAQRVVRSPASLRQRVTYLRGHGHERDGLLAQVAEWLPAHRGDSRLDVLCDLLGGLWYAEPDAKVLVAAGDNLTVDDLYDRLPGLLGAVGPEGQLTDVRPVRIRSQTRGADSLADSEDEIEDAVDEFVRGDANLMLAAAVGREGLNLQVTRHIVLYSVPWDPQELEQWIGRIDRIGNPATRRKGGERPQPILIHTIAQRGLVDERILRVMEETTILRRTISLDSKAVREVRDQIRAAAFGGDETAWRRVLHEALTLGQQMELENLGAPLVADLPFGPEQSETLWSRLRDAVPIDPAPGTRPEISGFARQQAAMQAWVNSMGELEEYDVRLVRSHHGVARLCYRVTPRPHGRPIVHSRSNLGEDLIKPPSWAVFFVAERRHVEQPPRREVSFDGRTANQLYFLGHGSPLHERLVETWQRIGSQGEAAFRLALPAAHPAHDALVDKVVALRIGWADPADLLDEPGALIRLAAAVGGEEPMARIEADRRLLAWLRADQRFLRSALPAMLVCDGAVLRSEADPEPLPPEVCRALLVPPPPAARPTSSDWEPSARVHEVADAAQRVLERRTPRTVQGEWARRAPHLREALAGRRYVLGVEQGEREEVAALAVGSLRRELADLRDAGAERGLVTRKTNQLLAEEARMLYLAQTHEARLGWLDGVEERLVRPSLHLFRIALVRVQGLRGE